MWLLAKHTAVVVSTILAFVALGLLLYGIREVLVVSLFAVFFAYLVEPWVSRLQRWRFVSRGSRPIAILEVYLLLAGVLTVLLLLIGPSLIEQGRKLAEALPGLLEKVSSGRIAQQIGQKHGWSYSTQRYAEHLLANHSATVLAWEGEIAASTAAFAQNVIWLLLIPILSVFFLKDGSEFASYSVAILERKRQRQLIRRIQEDINDMLAHFIRAQLLLAALSAFVYMAGLWLMQVPYALALGSIAGVMEFVPIVGPLVGAIAILGVAFLADYRHLLLIAIFLGIWRVVQDYVVSPRIMGRKLEIHPLAAILAVLGGAELAGVLGVCLSVPLMASVRILWRRWHAYSEASIKGGIISSVSSDAAQR
jgi:predicted PurR-regulated permease PerM